MPLQNDRRISIENLPISVKHLLGHELEYERMLDAIESHACDPEDFQISEKQCSVLLDLLDWLKMELT